MMTKINNYWNNKIFCKMPLAIHLTIVAIFSMATGFVRTAMNNKEASIANGVNFGIIKDLAIIYALLLGVNLITTYSTKIAKLMIENRVYTKMTHRINMSNIGDINDCSTGKVFDAMSSLASLKADLVMNIVYVIPCLMPALNLITKEFTSTKIGGISTLLSLFITTAMVLLTNKIFGWTDAAKAKKARLRGITVDNIYNVKTLKAIGKTRYGENRLSTAQTEALPVMANGAVMVWWRLIDAISWAPILINMYLARDNMGICLLVLTANYTIEHLRSTLTNIADVLQEIDAQNKTISILKGDDKHKKPILKKDIILKDIVFDHGRDTSRFKIKELIFRKGSRTLITGESGSGKSSLANLLTGSIKPRIGEIPEFDFCYIWQETDCLDDSLWNNIVFDNEYDVDEAEVIELFKELNMFEWFTTLPNGFDTNIGEKGCKLSSGQKQRVNIIRLIIEMRYAPQKVFIIDEITSNLDNNTKDIAIEMIDRECNSTLICISHNDGFDAICETCVEVYDRSFHITKKTSIIRDGDHDIKIWSNRPFDKKSYDSVKC